MADLTRSSAPGDRREMALGALLSLFGSGVQAAATLLVVIVLARWTTQETLGVFAAVTSLLLVLAATGQLGMTNTVVYFVARLRSTGRASLAPEPIRMAVTAVAGASTAIAVVLIVLAPQVSGAIFDDPTGQYESALRAGAVMIPAMALLAVILAGTEGFKLVRPTIFLDRMLLPLLQGATLLVLVVMVGSQISVTPLVLGWSAAWLLPTIAAGAWLLLVLRQHVPRSPDPGNPDAGTDDAFAPAELARYAGPRWVANLLQVVIQRGDVILVVMLAGPVEAALYVGASRFMVVGQMAQRALGVVAQPRLSGAISSGDRSRAFDVYAASTTWLVLLVWPLMLSVIWLAQPLLGFLGPEYVSAGWVIAVLAVAIMAATAAGMADLAVLMSGRSGVSLVNTAISAGVMLVVDLLLIPPLGAVGAAIGWGAAILTRNGLNVLVNRRLSGVRADLSVLLAAGLAIAIFGIPAGLLQLAAGPSAWLTAGTLLVGAIIYLVLIWKLRRRLHLDGLELPGRRSRT